jgi:hypothetical protein
MAIIFAAIFVREKVIDPKWIRNISRGILYTGNHLPNPRKSAAFRGFSVATEITLPPPNFRCGVVADMMAVN